MSRFLSIGVSILFGLVAAQACTVHQTEAPPLTGPSEFALSVAITASPDSLTRDGGSQSAITVTVRDINGQPVENQLIRVDTAVDGVLQDFGRLSARTLFTGADGTARVVFTAPPPPPPTSVNSSPVTVSIVATPTGTSGQALVSQHVDIRLNPLGVILPPAETPTAAFELSPTTPVIQQAVVFDASTSCAGAPPCSNTDGITIFFWRFGDGSTGSGESASHAYATGGTYTVTLTVTNERGVQASATRTVSVASSSRPTVDFVISPTTNASSPATISFTAINATPGTGRTIVAYDWNFGDLASGTSNTATGASVNHTFNANNTYNVVLTVTDDIGQVGTSTKAVKVGP